MMKKALVFMAISSLVLFNCTKKTTTNNYYSTPGQGGSIVGIVCPVESKAKVSAYMGIEVASTNIDAKGYFKLSGLPVGTYSLLVQAEGYDDYSKPYVKVTDGATAAVDTIFLISIHDLIRSVSPSDGAKEVDLDRDVYIEFRREMDRESVEKAFHIEPTIEGEFFWYRSDRLNFLPKDDFAANTRYQVTIDTTASDTAGTKMLEPYQFSFTTEPIRIVSTLPQPNETGVSPRTYIGINFNADMDMGSVNSAFKMVDSELNDVKGNFRWSSSRRSMRFDPNWDLAVNETYTVTIDTTARDAQGAKLSEPYQFSFATEAVEIEATSPAHNQTGVSPYNPVLIKFNTDMDEESVVSAFKMVDSGLNEVEGKFTWSSPPRDMMFRPNEALAFNETYTVTIDSTASSSKGARLPEPYQFSFTTMEVKVTSTSPPRDETWVSPNSKVYIYFSANMDMESVASAFSMVDSELKDVMGNFYWDRYSRMEFQPNLALAVNETYTVTVDTTASSAEGVRLSEPYQFSFTTQPLLIVSTKPKHKDTWVSPDSCVRIIFNTDMDMESADSAFKMVDFEQKEVSGSFVWEYPTVMEFHPDSVLASDEKYTVTIDTKAKDMHGKALSHSYTFWFRTRPEQF